MSFQAQCLHELVSSFTLALLFFLTSLFVTFEELDAFFRIHRLERPLYYFRSSHDGLRHAT
jgi:hypothetical protein